MTSVDVERPSDGSDVDTSPSRTQERLSPPWPWQRWVMTGLFVLFAFVAYRSFGRTNFAPSTVLDGVDGMRNLIDRMLPINFSEIDLVIRLSIETVFIAVIGTAFAVLLSLPLSFLAARNTAPNGVIMGVARGVIVASRAIPDLVFALIFVRAIGIGGVGGVTAGILAIGAHAIGMIGKLYADAIENIEEGAREAVLSTGATRLQTLSTGVLPQVTPSFIGVALYRFDINFRSSTILGYVGAGGIGSLLREYLSALRYDLALGITLVIVVLVLAVEFLSAAIRRQILGSDPFAGRRLSRRAAGVLRRRSSGAGAGAAPDGQAIASAPSGSSAAPVPAPVVTRLTPPWTPERIRMAGFGYGTLALLAASFVLVGLTPADLFRHFASIAEVATRLIPQDLAWLTDDVVAAMVETLAIGIASTTIGLLLSLPLALLVAYNVSPARWVYSVSRSFVVMVRAMPELIIAVLFVSAVGLGPFPGVLALSIGTVGFATKLFADAIEEIRQGPRDAVVSTGAGRLQEIFTSVVPQAMPAIVGTSVYVLDINIRASTILGIVGAGGIGFPLLQATRLLRWETVGGLMLFIFIVVYALERLSGWVRKQLL